MKNFNMKKIKNGRPVATSDRQIFSLRDPLNSFLCFAIVECALVSNDFHF